MWPRISVASNQSRFLSVDPARSRPLRIASSIEFGLESVLVGDKASVEREIVRLKAQDLMNIKSMTRPMLEFLEGLTTIRGLIPDPYFVGGGFGPKIMMFYPEEVLLPWVSMKLNRPIKWIEDRLEHFFATTHERGQIHDAEIALTLGSADVLQSLVPGIGYESAAADVLISGTLPVPNVQLNVLAEN